MELEIEAEDYDLFCARETAKADIQSGYSWTLTILKPMKSGPQKNKHIQKLKEMKNQMDNDADLANSVQTAKEVGNEAKKAFSKFQFDCFHGAYET